MSVNNGQGWSQWFDLNKAGSSFNMNALQIWSILARVATSSPVKVVGVNPAAQTVDMLPLINMVDGDGNAFKHQTIYGCPYFQLQSGTSAVVIVPTVGDIGIALFADRDMSNVIANKAQTNPGSGRMFDMSDGMYLGGMLNAAPTQFVEFTPDKIIINGLSAVDILDTLHSTDLEQMHDVFGALITYIDDHTHTYLKPSVGWEQTSPPATGSGTPTGTPNPFTGGNIVT